MIFQLHLYAVVLFASALTALITAFIILRRDVPGSRALGGVLLSSFVWSGSYAMVWSLTEFSAKLFWLKVAFLGVIAVPTLFLIFTFQITRNEKWLTPQTLLVLSAVPLFTLVLILFRMDLIFSHIFLEQKSDSSALVVEHREIGYWVHAVYSCALILLAFLVLGISAWQATLFFRRQYLVILLAGAIPFTAGIFTQISDRGPIEFDIAPISLGISSILFVYAVFRHQFMDLLPIVRSHLIESMSDGVLVLDAQGRILDVNPAMKNFLDHDESFALLGKNFTEAVRIWTHNAEQLLDGMETRTEIKLLNRPSQYLDLRITPLYDEYRKLSGRLIVFRDITDRKEVEKDLRQAMDRLQTQLIEIGVLQSQLREQAIRDPLTNVFNRRYLEETLEREVARAEREHYPLCVIMMDLDWFKGVNDTYGHEAGDQVLKALAETMMRQIRHGDFVCRYGGEEFVLVMPNINLAIAKQRAEDLRKLIGALNIPYGLFNLTTTISMGIAMYPEHGKTKEDLLRAADRAMYSAKNTGRNRVVIYVEQEVSAE